MNSTKKLLFLCLIFSFTHFFGQTYFPFPDSNAVWSVDKTKTIIGGDTIVNSLTYKKYYSTIDTTLSPDSLYLIGLLRQDLPNKKIYGLHLDSINEKLMYDFNLQINDFVDVYSVGFWFQSEPAHNLQVVLIDSVLINNSYRKRFIFNDLNMNSWWSEFWIEGIGSKYGPMNSGLSKMTVTDVCQPILLCQKQDSILLYVNSQYNSCYFETCLIGLRESFEKQYLEIFPNPSSDKISIDYNGNITFPISIQILNSIGGLIKTIHFQKQTDIQINVKEINEGLYFIKIATEQHTFIKPFIKN